MGATDYHWSFVIASYAVTGLVLGGLIVSIILDLRRQKKLVAGLEAEGTRRRGRAGEAG